MDSTAVPQYEDEGEDLLSGYMETISMIERLHRQLLDVIRTELERVGVIEVNGVQALLLFNIGDNVVAAGDLKSRGYYHGSNVSYNLNKLAELGYVHSQRSEVDRRSVRVRLTEKGLDVHFVIASLFQRHAEELGSSAWLRSGGLAKISRNLCSIERYWAETMRSI